MITDFRSLHPDDSLTQAVEHVVAGFQQDFPVIEHDRLAGVLTRNDLVTALSRSGPQGRVADAMQRDVVTADPREMLQVALARLQNCGCHTMPVAENGRVVGLVTTDHLAEALMVHEALRESRGRGEVNGAWGGRRVPTRADAPTLDGRPRTGAV
jgi:CBS domain-containing protein